MPRRTSPPRKAAVERQNRIRRIGEAEIYQYARDRKFEETAIALSIMCDTPIDVVERALLDPGAEIVLILAKVAGLSSTTTKAMLLLRAADRGMSAKDLEHALIELQSLAAGYCAPRARLLPHPREKAGRADGAAGGRRQRLNETAAASSAAGSGIAPRRNRQISNGRATRPPRHQE